MNLYIDYDGIAYYQNDDGVYIVVVENDILKYLLCRLMSYVPMYGVKHSYNEKFTVRSFFKLLGNYPLLKRLNNNIEILIEEVKNIENNPMNENRILISKVHKNMYDDYIEVQRIHKSFDYENTTLSYFQEYSDTLIYLPIEKYIGCPIIFGSDYVNELNKDKIRSLTFIEFLKAMIDNICICGSRVNLNLSNV